MRAEERKLIEGLAQSVDSIRLALVGDDSLGIPGLVKRQEQDERAFLVINRSLQDINTNVAHIKEKQERQWQKINTLLQDTEAIDNRVKTVEKVINFFRSLPKYKKAILATIGSTITTLTLAKVYWAEFKIWLLNHF